MLKEQFLNRNNSSFYAITSKKSCWHITRNLAFNLLCKPVKLPDLLTCSLGIINLSKFNDEKQRGEREYPVVTSLKYCFHTALIFTFK